MVVVRQSKESCRAPSAKRQHPAERKLFDGSLCTNHTSAETISTIPKLAIKISL
jgi:hypothetical protein